jgi:hypothetical protein
LYVRVSGELCVCVFCLFVCLFFCFVCLFVCLLACLLVCHSPIRL